MNKLDYGNFDVTNADIAFSAVNGYSDPASEIETRKQLSYPLKEIKTFVNNTVSVDSNDNAVQLEVNANNSLSYRTSPGGALTSLSGGIPSGGTTGQILKKSSNSDYDTEWGSTGDAVPVLTTEPTEAYTGGGAKIVYLESEPATKYAGYIYLIKD